MGNFDPQRKSIIRLSWISLLQVAVKLLSLVAREKVTPDRASAWSL